MAQDKSKQTVLHALASVKNGKQTLAYQLLWNILNKPSLEIFHLKQILMQRNGKGDNVLHILAKEANLEASLKILENVLQLYADNDLKERLEAKSNPLKLAIMNKNTEGAKIWIDNGYS